LPAINLNNKIDSLPPEEKIKRKSARQKFKTVWEY